MPAPAPRAPVVSHVPYQTCTFDPIDMRTFLNSARGMSRKAAQPIHRVRTVMTEALGLWYEAVRARIVTPFNDEERICKR